MKRISILILFFTTFLVIGCSEYPKTKDIIVWENEFPTDKFFSYYATMEPNTEVKFISPNGNEKKFLISDASITNNYIYVDRYSSDYGFRASNGWVSSFYICSNQKNNAFEFFAEVYNRYFFGISLSVDNKKIGSYTATTPYDSLYIPYDPDAIAKHITDTIYLKDKYNKKVAEVVAGEGITYFIDNNGTMWKRVR